MTIALPPLAAARRPRRMPAWKITFYRQCRLWHGWLSAFAFITLMFFSATGLLLNHPEWFAGDPALVESHARLAPMALKGKAAPALAALLTARKLVHGVYASGDIDDGMALLRFKQAYAAAGLDLDATELPDHLAVVLEFAATGDLAQGRRLLVEHRAGLELLRLSLAEAGSPWTAVLEAVSATLPPLTGRNEEAVARLIAEGPPEEEVGLAPYGTASGPVFLPDPVLEARS